MHFININKIKIYYLFLIALEFISFMNCATNSFDKSTKQEFNPTFLLQYIIISKWNQKFKKKKTNYIHQLKILVLPYIITLVNIACKTKIIMDIFVFDGVFLTLKCTNYFFCRFSKYNLRYATIVYRLIGAAHIGNFFDDPFLISN